MQVEISIAPFSLLYLPAGQTPLQADSTEVPEDIHMLLIVCNYVLYICIRNSKLTPNDDSVATRRTGRAVLYCFPTESRIVPPFWTVVRANWQCETGHFPVGTSGAWQTGTKVVIFSPWTNIFTYCIR